LFYPFIEYVHFLVSQILKGKMDMILMFGWSSFYLTFVCFEFIFCF